MKRRRKTRRHKLHLGGGWIMERATMAEQREFQDAEDSGDIRKTYYDPKAVTVSHAWIRRGSNVHRIVFGRTGGSRLNAFYDVEDHQN